MMCQIQRSVSWLKIKLLCDKTNVNKHWSEHNFSHACLKQQKCYIVEAITSLAKQWFDFVLKLCLYQYLMCRYPIDRITYHVLSFQAAIFVVSSQSILNIHFHQRTNWAYNTNVFSIGHNGSVFSCNFARNIRWLLQDHLKCSWNTDKSLIKFSGWQFS